MSLTILKSRVLSEPHKWYRLCYAETVTRLENALFELRSMPFRHPIEEAFVKDLANGVSMSQALSTRKDIYRAKYDRASKRPLRSLLAQHRNVEFVAAIEQFSREDLYVLYVATIDSDNDTVAANSLVQTARYDSRGNQLDDTAPPAEVSQSVLTRIPFSDHRDSIANKYRAEMEDYHEAKYLLQQQCFNKPDLYEWKLTKLNQRFNRKRRYRPEDVEHLASNTSSGATGVPVEPGVVRGAAAHEKELNDIKPMRSLTTYKPPILEGLTKDEILHLGTLELEVARQLDEKIIQTVNRNCFISDQNRYHKCTHCGNTLDKDKKPQDLRCCAMCETSVCKAYICPLVCTDDGVAADPNPLCRGCYPYSASATTTNASFQEHNLLNEVEKGQLSLCHLLQLSGVLNVLIS